MIYCFFGWLYVYDDISTYFVKVSSYCLLIPNGVHARIDLLVLGSSTKTVVSEKKNAGVANIIARIHIITAVNTVNGFVYILEKFLYYMNTCVIFCNRFDYTCSFRRGLTMAQQRSAESAVSVNTETPIDTSLADSVMRHSQLPHGHDSSVYNIDASGTHINITSRSASASEKMQLK